MVTPEWPPMTLEGKNEQRRKHGQDRSLRAKRLASEGTHGMTSVRGRQAAARRESAVSKEMEDHGSEADEAAQSATLSVVLVTWATKVDERTTSSVVTPKSLANEGCRAQAGN